MCSVWYANSAANCEQCCSKENWSNMLSFVCSISIASLNCATQMAPEVSFLLFQMCLKICISFKSQFAEQGHQIHNDAINLALKVGNMKHGDSPCPSNVFSFDCGLEQVATLFTFFLSVKHVFLKL